ncbi:Uncharacterised protein [Clostridioides difficile]|nr:Uncharacterised protein [Clostridioides difficile]VIB78812.1 Uncharacterised protein [Clostridioides difficile]
MSVAVFNAVTASFTSFCVTPDLSNIACALSIAVLYIAFDPTLYSPTFVPSIASLYNLFAAVIVFFKTTLSTFDEELPPPCEEPPLDELPPDELELGLFPLIVGELSPLTLLIVPLLSIVVPLELFVTVVIFPSLVTFT